MGHMVHDPVDAGWKRSQGHQRERTPPRRGSADTTDGGVVRELVSADAGYHPTAASLCREGYLFADMTEPASRED
jgi:hypothetical protein